MEAGKTKRVKAPDSYHWMKKGNSYKLMKHTGKFVKHPGASLYANFPIQKGMIVYKTNKSSYLKEYILETNIQTILTGE